MRSRIRIPDHFSTSLTIAFWNIYGRFSRNLETWLTSIDKRLNPLNFRIRRTPGSGPIRKSGFESLLVKVRGVGEGMLSLWVLCSFFENCLYCMFMHEQLQKIKTFFLSKYETPNRRRSIDHRRYLKVGATFLSFQLSLFASGCRPRSGVPSKRRVLSGDQGLGAKFQPPNNSDGYIACQNAPHLK